VLTPTRKEFGRLASKRFIQSVFGSPSHSEWTEAKALARTAKRVRLRKSLELSNGDVFGLSVRLMNEMEFTTMSTPVAFYTKCFTGNAMVKWAMEQDFRGHTFRDEADALFLGNEMLIRGIVQPVARGERNANSGGVKTMTMSTGIGKSWKTFRGGEWTYRIKVRSRAELIACCFGNSTEEEKDQIRECAGKMKTLKSLIDGDLESDKEEMEEAVEEEVVEFFEREVTAYDKMEELKIAVRHAFTWKGTLGKPYRLFVRIIEYIEDEVVDFFSTLGPHIAVAFGSLLFAVWLENFALACVLAATFMRHIIWLDEHQREILADKVRSDQLRKFQRIRGDPKVNRNGAETADWWSSILDHMWRGWLEGWLNRLIRAQLESLLDSIDFAFISKIELSEFKLGSSGPCFKHARTYSGVDGEMVVEKDLDWQTRDLSILISALFGKANAPVPIPIRVRASDLRISGHMRLVFSWMRTPGGPYVRSFRVSFIGLPKYSFSIKALGAINLSEIGMIDSAIRKAVDEFLLTEVCEPEGFFWDVKEWWNEMNHDVAEEIINPTELITPQLMKDVERIWRRRPKNASVEIRIMPNFVELDLSGKNLLIKRKYLDGTKCRMYIAVVHGKKRVVTKAHHMEKHMEAEDENTAMPTWDSAGFTRLDCVEEALEGQLSFFLLSEYIEGNSAKATANKLFNISRKVVAVARIEDFTKYKGGDIHNMELTLLGARSMRPVGILHLRIRINVLNENVKVDDVFAGAVGTLSQQLQRMNTTIGAQTRKVTDVAELRRALGCWGCFGYAPALCKPKDDDIEDEEEDFGVNVSPRRNSVDAGIESAIKTMEDEIIMNEDEFYSHIEKSLRANGDPPPAAHDSNH